MEEANFKKLTIVGGWVGLKANTCPAAQPVKIKMD